MEGYETLGVLGEGTYGVVVKARHRATGRLVAIKKYKQAEDDDHVRKTSLREVRVLKQLRHPNVISLLDVFRRDGKLYLVFEYVENTILQLIEEKRHGLHPDDVRRYTYQLLNGVDYCHAHNIIHRDVKPENILVSKDGVLKLCDFGFARQLSSKGKYTDYVATRWYRAPELLVGDVAYGKAVDIWAIGCIFAELSNGQPLFPGDSDLDQLTRIMRSCGPIPARMVDIFEHNSLYRRVAFPSTRLEESLQKCFYNCKASWLDFLLACLRTDPVERPSCAALMNTPYFTEDNFRAEYDAELRALFTQYQTPADTTVLTVQPAAVNPQQKAPMPPGEAEETTDVVLPHLAVPQRVVGGLEASDEGPPGSKGTPIGVSVGNGGGGDGTPYQQLGTLWNHYLGATLNCSGSNAGELPSISSRQMQTHHTMATPIFNSGKNAAKLDRVNQELFPSPLQSLKVAGGHSHGTTNPASPISQPQGAKVAGGASVHNRRSWKNQPLAGGKNDPAGGWKSGSLKKSLKLNYPMFPALPSGPTSPVPQTGHSTTSSLALNVLSVLRDANTNTIPKAMHPTQSSTVPTTTTATPTTTTTSTTTANAGTGNGAVVNSTVTKHKKKQSKRAPVLGGITGSQPRVPGNTTTYQSVTGQKCSLHDVPSKR